MTTQALDAARDKLMAMPSVIAEPRLPSNPQGYLDEIKELKVRLDKLERIFEAVTLAWGSGK